MTKNDPRIPIPQDAVMAEVQRERDMLRAEREVWATIAQERNDLRTEVARLTAEVERLRQIERAYDRR